jgi:putative phosphoribosyl transferase
VILHENENKDQNLAVLDVFIELAKVTLQGILGLPAAAKGIVLFAHGSGSSRFSPRNGYVAEVLQSRGIATLLFDLLTPEEEAFDQRTAALRFDIQLLTKRLASATSWAMRQPKVRGLDIGYFGASTGAAAALMAAAQRPEIVSAVVSRGGRPDLAGKALAAVRAPTLLIVGGNDGPVIALNQQALAELGCREKEIVIVPEATHLFEEPGALEQVADVAAQWFGSHFAIAGQGLVRHATQARRSG